MLPKHIPAEYLTFSYLDKFNIRVHIHTDAGSLWIPLKDILDVLNLTNPSYFSSKILKENQHKHIIQYENHKRYAIVWVNLEGANEILEYIATDKARKFHTWLHTYVKYLCANTSLNGVKHTFKEGIIIEKKDLLTMKDLITRICYSYGL